MLYDLTVVRFIEAFADFLELPLLEFEYALMASAARNDLERFELLARASRRFFVPASMRMERVSVVGICVWLYTLSHERQLVAVCR